MRTITRAVRGGACIIAATALAAGMAPATASTTVTPAQRSTATTTTTATTMRAASPATKTVRLKLGTKPGHRIRTQALAARELLAQVGVTVDDNDRVQVVHHGHAVRAGSRRVLRTGDTVKVTWVTRGAWIKDVRVKRQTKARHVTSLKPGKRKVVRSGHDGIRRLRIEVTKRNGRVVSRTVTRHWVSRPASRMVLVGRSAMTALNWAGLARCESGGNPRAVNSAGYYGLYQFGVGTWRSVGGSGMPNKASASEQTYRAQRLYASRGRSPWPYCGRFL